MSAFAFLLPANEVWGKVMFLHLPISHSVHEGGGVCLWVQGVCLPLGFGVDVYHPPPRHTPLHSNTHTRTLGHPAVEVAIEAGGTHPTGMHSCCT